MVEGHELGDVVCWNESKILILSRDVCVTNFNNMQTHIVLVSPLV